MTTDLRAHLTLLSELHGPSGFEFPIQQAVRAAWTPLVDSIEVGRLGDLIALKRGVSEQPRRVMICAHMDEIGLIVKRVEHGVLKVSRLGGVDARTLPGLPVKVHGKQTLPGVVGVRPLWAIPEDRRAVYPTLNDLWIDVGLPAEEVAAWVSVGDTVTVDVPVSELQGSRLAGKAMDDRACIAAITACLEGLQSRKHGWDVLAVASTQEEGGVNGAAIVAYQEMPDIAIALDVTFALQPGVSEGAYKLNDGVVISLGANFHPALYDALCAAADRLEIATHADPLPAHSGTDAWPIQVARDGIPVALVNIPVRNMHTSAELVDLNDIERVGRVLAEFISALAPDFLSTIVWDKP